MKLKLGHIQFAYRLTRLVGENGVAGDEVIFDVDYDYPGLAQNLGWNMRDVQRNARRNDPCDHRGTDGSINCPDCGVRAVQFIDSAGAWLHRHLTHVFVDTPADEYFTLDLDEHIDRYTGTAQFHCVVTHDQGSPDVFRTETYTVRASDRDDATDIIRERIEQQGGLVNAVMVDGYLTYGRNGS